MDNCDRVIYDYIILNKKRKNYKKFGQDRKFINVKYKLNFLSYMFLQCLI